jgi:hypothetical protein
LSRGGPASKFGLSNRKLGKEKPMSAANRIENSTHRIGGRPRVDQSRVSPESKKVERGSGIGKTAKNHVQERTRLQIRTRSGGSRLHSYRGLILDEWVLTQKSAEVEHTPHTIPARCTTRGWKQNKSPCSTPHSSLQARDARHYTEVHHCSAQLASTSVSPLPRDCDLGT